MSHPAALKGQLEKLVHVQEIDLKIQSLSQKKSQLPKPLKTLDETLHSLQKKITERSEIVKDLDKGYRQVLAAMEMNQERMDRTNKKVDGVTNNKEFQAASKEVEQLKKHNEQLEAQKKDFETKLGAAKQELETLTAEKQKTQAQRDEEAQKIGKEDGEIGSQIGLLTTQRNSSISGIDGSLLSKYDRIRVARAGLGIVPAVSGRCKGCNLMVPPQLFNKTLRGEELISCPSCHRIIYIPSEPGKSAASN